MNWEQLLSLRKYGDIQNRNRNTENPNRIGFEVDYDRIVFSSIFRSLQDKTQVIPMSKTNFVHTRLTHSLEVSVVARSLGRIAGEKLLLKYPYLSSEYGYTIQDFGAILSAAALAHDIGNPPFGHSGEKAISDFFKSGDGHIYKSEISEQNQWYDLINFEGNANGFMALTASRPGINGGLRISYATLGAFTKYPKESVKEENSALICDKKYGFFQRDKEAFLDISTELGLIDKGRDYMAYHRHPLAYLLEAADDICYSIIDFEDGINLGWLPESYAMEYQSEIFKDYINNEQYSKLSSKEERISYLRALSIGGLINDAVNVFLDNETDILQGKFNKPLMSESKYSKNLNDIINISSENIYSSKEVVEKELLGYQVLHTILKYFCGAVDRKHKGTQTHIDKLLLKVLPEKYHTEEESVYGRLINICHFVSMLTDGKALEIYRSIKAI